MVWIDADRVLVPCPVDDRELPVTDAVAFPALHVVAYVRTEVIAHAHRRIGRNADDRIAVSIGIALVRQAVRKAGPPGHIESERMSPSHRCTMPNKVSSRLKWSMWRFART